MSNKNGDFTGAHYLDGDHACAEGAIAAGCNFVAGYPITAARQRQIRRLIEARAARITGD